MRKLIYIMLVGTIALCSCTTTRQLNYLQDKEPHYAMHPFEDYKLQKNDEIYCTILTKDFEFASEFNQSNQLNQYDQILSTSGQGGQQRGAPYTIYENGYISIPFFGDIKVVGLTIPEAEEVILRKMKDVFPDAQVKVALGNNIFYVISSDGNNVSQIYKDNMTIYQALSVSRDVSKGINIDLSKVKIVRIEEDGNSVVKTFDLRTTSVIESEFYYVKPNDVIYYSRSTGSFFKITSVWSFVSTVLVPITFIAYVLANLK